MDVFDLAVEISINTTEYEKGLSEAGDKTSQFASLIKTGISNAAKAGAAAMSAMKTVIGVVSNEMINTVTSSEECKSGLQDLQSAFGEAKNNLMSEFVPGMSEVMEGLTDIFGGDSSGIDTIKEGVESIAINFQEMLPQIVESISEFLPGIVEMLVESFPLLVECIQQLIVELANVLTENFPQLLEAVGQILSTIVSAIGELLPVLAETALQLIIQLGNGIIQNLPMIVSKGAELVYGLADGIREGLPLLVEQAVNMITELTSGLGGMLGTIIDAGIEIIISLIDGIVEALPNLLEKIPEIINNLHSALVSNLPKILDGGVRILASLVTGIVKTIPKLIETIPKIFMAIQDVLKDFSLSQIGANLIRGLWEGMKSLGDWLWKNVKGLFSDIFDGVLEFLGIHSPSRKFAWIGRMCVEGFNNGFSGLTDGTVIDEGLRNIESRLRSVDIGIAASSTDPQTIRLLEKILSKMDNDSTLVLNKREFGRLVRGTA